MSIRWILAIWCVVVVAGGACVQGREPSALLELKIGTQRLEGRIAAHDDERCWVLCRDGRLASFKTDDVTDFQEIQPRFRPYSSLDIRDKLQAEFGREYEVKTTSHYVVVGSRGTANRYAELFERIYRQFHTYITTRGFRVSEPEFPLVAVVLPNQQAFNDYCTAEGTRPQQGLLGYYLPNSNRVALYDRVSDGQGTDEDVDDTIIHEGTHQVAFNTGVHSRIGPSPLWLVEGLATLFEVDGIRKRESGAEVWDRVNAQRLNWFQNYRKRRPANSLEAFISEDKLFNQSVMDAYSQAWALTFYLSETRPAEFAKYLKTVADRDPLRKYDAEARLKDFHNAFGRDLPFLESQMLRYYDRLGE